MPARRQKTLHYRSATWLHDNAQTLESYVRQATYALATVQDRTIEYGEDHYVRCLRSRRRHAGGIFLHLTADTPGEPATTVPKNLAHPDLDVGEVAPPDDAEFMDGDAFLFIRDDHVCFCTGVLREGSIMYFLSQLFAKADLGDQSGAFVLKKVADADKIEMIREQGVKEIELNASVFAATTHYAGRGRQPVGMLRAIARVFYSLRDDDNEDRQDNLMLALSISADGRVKSNPDLGYERLEELAEKILETQEEGDDYYTIVTKDGQKITAAKIILQKPVELPASGKTVSREPTWQALHSYFDELCAENLIVAP